MGHKSGDNDIKKKEISDEVEENTKKIDLSSTSTTLDDDLEETKELEEISDLANDLLEDETLKKDNVEEDETSLEKKGGNKKKVVAIILICIVVILFVILIVVLNINRKNEKKNHIDKDTTDIVLSEDDKKQMITDYGLALEEVISDYYQKNQVIISFDEANKLVKLKDDVVCNDYEVYDDGKIYLTNCSVNGKMTEYGYGIKQEPKEEFDSNVMFKVYVNNTTGEIGINTISTSDFAEYVVHCGGEYSSPTLLGYSDYVFYYDSDYNVQMKNFKTDKKVLEKINYIGVLPFYVDNYYDTKYVAVNVSDKWGIYDLETSKAVVAPRYDAVAIKLTMGTSGPPLRIETLKGSNIVVWKSDKYGVINYTTGKEVIPITNDSLLRSGNYLWATIGDDNVIYDFSGNKYLTEGYDKVYGISGGTYVLVKQDSLLKLIQLDGKVVYEYGEDLGLGKLNFALDYDGDVLFQFSKDGSMCIEYSYDPDSKTGGVEEKSCS